MTEKDFRLEKRYYISYPGGVDAEAIRRARAQLRGILWAHMCLIRLASAFVGLIHLENRHGDAERNPSVGDSLVVSLNPGHTTGILRTGILVTASLIL